LQTDQSLVAITEIGQHYGNYKATADNEWSNGIRARNVTRPTEMR
jgi:hypothetical protein